MPKKTNISQVATKSDVENLKGDIQRLEKTTKKDLKSLEDKLGAKLDKIAITLDGFVGRVDNLTIENQVGVNQARELRVQIDDHEVRITKIESPVSL